ncbi:MAG: hypothetical protein QM750_25840 [Rubrivivax sp.]
MEAIPPLKRAPSICSLHFPGLPGEADYLQALRTFDSERMLGRFLFHNAAELFGL